MIARSELARRRRVVRDEIERRIGLLIDGRPDLPKGDQMFRWGAVEALMSLRQWLDGVSDRQSLGDRDADV